MTTTADALSLAGIEKAAGLDDARAAEQLEACVDVLSATSAKNALLDVYRDGTIPVEDCAERVPSGTVYKAACPWGNVAVQSIVERSRFKGFTFADPESEAAVRMAEIMRRQPMASGYSRALRSGVTYGPAFVTVGRGELGPVVRWHTARTATGIWDMGERRLECGLAIVKTGRRGRGLSIEPTACDLYVQGGVWELTRAPDWTGWGAEFKPDPLGEPRMLAMPFLADDEAPLGHTRLSAAVRGIIREYVANALNVHVASVLYAVGQKAIMGLTARQFDEMRANKSGYALESLFLGMMDKDGNSPRLEQWSQQSMEPLLSVKRSLAQDFAAATSVPISELISQDSNPTSAEALTASKDKLISLVESVNEDNREVLRRVALAMQAIDSGRGLDGLSEDQLSVSAHMRDASTPSAAALADSTLKMAQVIEGYGDSEVCMERLGFDEAERVSIRGAQRRRQARLGATAVLDRNRGVGDEGYSGGAGQV